MTSLVLWTTARKFVSKTANLIHFFSKKSQKSVLIVNKNLNESNNLIHIFKKNFVSYEHCTLVTVLTIKMIIRISIAKYFLLLLTRNHQL